MRKDGWQVTISSVRCQHPKTHQKYYHLVFFSLNLQRRDRLATHMSIIRLVPLCVDVRGGVQREGGEGKEGRRRPTPGSPSPGEEHYEPDEPGGRRQSGGSVRP